MIPFVNPYLGTNPLPWRLTKEAIKCIERRIQNIVYPHGIDGCSNDEGSFINGFCSWRAADRILALLVIMPTVLRDYVDAVHVALCKFVLGLRILQGRCLNHSEACDFGVAPGSTPLSPADIDKAEKLIVEGLSMLEGLSCCDGYTICHTNG